ncbi:hypothetical protein Fcan01_24148 [Folsomia candida]|uniref:Uncharacterized protein n=1 Tax=Folsomia candida TaxID=158441 RepID=A0A226D6M8_FOLCA|nr:hypothetical protein Fcan01_24148 [Folsomia candida]
MDSQTTQFNNNTLALGPGVDLPNWGVTLHTVALRKLSKKNAKVLQKSANPTSPGNLIRSLEHTSEPSHANCRQREEELLRKLGQNIKFAETGAKDPKFGTNCATAETNDPRTNFLAGLLSDPMAELHARRNNTAMLASLLRNSNLDSDEGEDDPPQRGRVRHVAGTRKNNNIL